MRYCGNAECNKLVALAFYDTERFCDKCGGETTPYIQCLCGEKAFHPRNLPKFCTACGTTITDTYLGQCMSAQVKGMVKEIAAKQAEPLMGGFLD